jgi:hypothetical protein
MQGALAEALIGIIHSFGKAFLLGFMTPVIIILLVSSAFLGEEAKPKTGEDYP